MEIMHVYQLQPNDRFALKDWNKAPENRIVYRMPETPQDAETIKNMKQRKTVDVICENGGAPELVSKNGYLNLKPNNNMKVEKSTTSTNKAEMHIVISIEDAALLQTAALQFAEKVATDKSHAARMRRLAMLLDKKIE